MNSCMTRTNGRDGETMRENGFNGFKKNGWEEMVQWV